MEPQFYDLNTGRVPNGQSLNMQQGQPPKKSKTEGAIGKIVMAVFASIFIALSILFFAMQHPLLHQWILLWFKKNRYSGTFAACRTACKSRRRLSDLLNQHQPGKRCHGVGCRLGNHARRTSRDAGIS